MKSILVLQNLGAGEIIVIVLFFLFIFFIIRMINAAKDGQNGKVLRKSDDRILCGVCGGIAEYFNVSSFLVRFLFLSTGIGIGAYLIMAIVMRD